MDLVPVKNGKLLDVGCGLGWTVAEAQKRGFTAVGIDPKIQFVNFGKKKFGVNLQTTSLEKFKTKEKFVVVILKHVLEHIVKPEPFLSKIREVQGVRGCLVVACPNMNSLMARIFLDRWYGLKIADLTGSGDQVIVIARKI